MAELNQQQVIEYIKGISVLELSQLVKALETELGVSAAAAMPMAMPGGGGAARGGRGRGEDRVQRHPHRGGRQEDQRHQGRSRSHQPGPQGSQGPGRGRPEADQGRRAQGRGRGDPQEVRRGRREGRDQVSAEQSRRATRPLQDCSVPIERLQAATRRLKRGHPSRPVRRGAAFGTFTGCTAFPRTFTASASTSRRSRRRFRSRT